MDKDLSLTANVVGKQKHCSKEIHGLAYRVKDTGKKRERIERDKEEEEEQEEGEGEREK